MVDPRGTPIVGASDSSVPIGPSPSSGYHDPRRNPSQFTRRRSVSFCTSCLLFLVLLFILRLFFAVFTTLDYGVQFLFVLIYLLPAAVVGWFILSRFRDEDVGRPFLFLQFRMGGIPLVLFIKLFETTTLAAASIPTVFAILYDLPENLPKILQAARAPAERNTKAVEQLTLKSSQSIALWSSLLTVVSKFITYVTTGALADLGNGLLLTGTSVLNTSAVGTKGCRRIMASACMVAPGFATIKNMGGVSGMARAASHNSSTEQHLVFLGFFRGVLAYPVHVGAQLYVVIAASYRHIFMDDVSVNWALFHAILFHGTFDVLTSLTALFALRILPAWMSLLVPAIDIIMIVLLLLLCRARYKALLVHQRMATSESL